MNTSGEGIALLIVNTTGLPNGEYFLKIQVTYGGETVYMGTLWDNPRVNIRNFEVRGEIGNRAYIPGFIEISESAGNIQIMQSDSMFHNVRINFWPSCQEEGACLKRGDWEFWNFYYNDSSNMILIDPTPMDFFLSPEDIAGAEKFTVVDNSTIINYTTPKRGVRVLANITLVWGEGPSPSVSGFNISLEALHDIGEVMYSFGSEDGRIVRVFNNSNYIFYLYTSSLVDHEEWEDSPNYVTVTDILGNLVGDYSFSEPISELGGKSVAKAGNWDRDVVLTNATVGGYAIKFPQWVCDNTNEYFVANFSEQSINAKFEPEDGPPEQRNLTAMPYYMLLYDGECDSANQVTSAKMTNVMNNNTVDFSVWGNGMYEMKIGEQWGWPFLLNSFDEESLQAGIFKNVWDLFVGENTNIWIGAREFNARPVTGNATLLSVKRITYTKTGEEQSIVNLTGTARLDSNGNAYVPLNLENESWGDYTVKVKVTSNVTGRSEIQENRLFVMDPDMIMMGDDCMEDCMEGDMI